MALREINMVPWDLLEKNTLSRHFWFWTKGLILVAVLLGCIYLAQYFWMDLQKQKQLSLDPIGNQVALKTQAINELQGRIQKIQKKNLSLFAMDQGQVFFEIITIFSNCLNDQTWINTLSIQRDPDDITILSCEGRAWTHHSLGLFLNQLAQAPRIQEVVLENATNSDTAARPATDPESPENQASPNRAARVPGLVHFKISAKIVRAP